MKTLVKYFISSLIKIFYLESLLVYLFKNIWSPVKGLNNNFYSKIIYKIFFIYYENEIKKNNNFKLRSFIKKIYLDTTNQGLDVASYYYEKNNWFKIKNEKIGDMTNLEATPSFEGFEKILKKFESNNIDKKKIFVIVIGSSSGRDIEYLSSIEPNINYISMDLTDEILNFQKEKINIKNIYFCKCYAEEIDFVINKFNLNDKYNIIFANGGIQYMVPSYFEEFIQKIKYLKNLYINLVQPVEIYFYENEDFEEDFKIRDGFSFSYKYLKIFKKNKFEIIDHRLIKPYKKKNHPNHGTAHCYLLAENK